MTKQNQIFDHKPDQVRSPLMQGNVTATECRGWLVRIHTCVKRERRIFWV